MTHTIKDQILPYIQTSLTPNNSGWYPVICKVCNDHGKKGPRGGFRFGDDGNTIEYNCFNCKHHSSYNPVKYSIIDKSTEETFASFNIPIEILLPFQFQYFGNRRELATTANIKLNEPQVIIQPDDWIPMDVDNPAHTEAVLYLYKRGIDINHYNFFLSTDKKWVDRIIIPIYNKNNELIFYQGRLYKLSSTSKTKNRKYLSSAVERSNIIFGYDIFSQESGPLYITEGWFDAYSINGCCIFENKPTQQQIELLKRSSRQKVYIPDREGSGEIGANIALDLGWYVSTPDIGTCKDMNEAVVKYGLMYVMSTLVENTLTGFAGKTSVSIWCK